MSAELKAPTSEIVSPALIRVGSTDLLGGTVMRDAIPADLPAIDSLRKKEGDALGFIPIGAYQSVTMKAPVDGRWRHLHSRLVILIDNGDITDPGHTAINIPSSAITTSFDASTTVWTVCFPVSGFSYFYCSVCNPLRLNALAFNVAIPVLCCTVNKLPTLKLPSWSVAV